MLWSSPLSLYAISTVGLWLGHCIWLSSLSHFLTRSQEPLIADFLQPSPRHPILWRASPFPITGFLWLCSFWVLPTTIPSCLRVYMKMILRIVKASCRIFFRCLFSLWKRHSWGAPPLAMHSPPQMRKVAAPILWILWVVLPWHQTNVEGSSAQFWSPSCCVVRTIYLIFLYSADHICPNKTDIASFIPSSQASPPRIFDDEQLSFIWYPSWMLI